jgi:hypothetical protein
LKGVLINVQLIATDAVACRCGEDGSRKSCKVPVTKLKKEYYRIPVYGFINTDAARSIWRWSGRNGGTPLGRRRGVERNDADALDAVWSLSIFKAEMEVEEELLSVSKRGGKKAEKVRYGGRAVAGKGIGSWKKLTYTWTSSSGMARERTNGRDRERQRTE